MSDNSLELSFGRLRLKARGRLAIVGTLAAAFSLLPLPDFAPHTATTCHNSKQADCGAKSNHARMQPWMCWKDLLGFSTR